MKVLCFAPSSSLLVAMLAACSTGTAAPPTGAPPPTQVSFIALAPQSVQLTKELPARVAALRVAEVRARANGIVLKRLFVEGAEVRADQPLFTLDPAPYAATLRSAEAQAARARAVAGSAKTIADRYAKLIETNAISRQEYEDAVAQLATARADAAAADAAVDSARINLGYTTVRAPVAGRIGRALVTEGAYVQQTQATQLATIQQIAQVYVDMTWSSSEALSLKRALEAGELKAGAQAASVAITLEDGRTYDQPGTLQFTDVSVDQTTGALGLRALVPNPRAELLPGMFVRARIDEGTSPNALLVPQRAVTRDNNGHALAFVVSSANTAEARPVVADRVVGDAWLVTQGLAPGDRVIVEGLQKIRPGAPVTPVPFSASGTAASGTAASGTAASGTAASGTAPHSAQPAAKP